MGIKSIVGAVKAFGSKHSTAITVAVSIVGYAGAIATAISETRTFDARIEELKIANDGKPVEKKEIVKTAAKSYWKTAVIFGVATTSLIMGQRAAYKKTMALTTAYQMTEKAFSEYKSAVKKTLTEKQQQKVQNEEAKEVVKDVTPAAIESAERVPTASSEVQLCMERWTRRLFYANPVELKEGFNRFKERYLDDEIASLNDLLDEWGLTTYDNRLQEGGVGARLGWRRDVIGGALELQIDSTLTTDGLHTIYVVGTNVFPEYDFDAFKGY